MKKVSFVLLLLGGFTLTAFGQSATAWRTKIAPEILAALGNGQTTDILVVFRDQADLSGAKSLHTKSEKAHFVYNRLIATADRSQASALRLLREKQAFINSFYLVNAIAVTRADAATIQKLAGLEEVKAITADPEVHFTSPETTTSTEVGARDVTEWGIEKIHASTVWALGFTGQGITVGGADTGYDWVHPALQPHYRGWNAANGSADHNYNWHDAIHELSMLSGDTTNNPWNNPCGLNSPVPCDDNSHGTHTMGTMTGDDGMGNQIGVAPGAKWIACRNMERGNGKPSSYIECFQWFLAPTDINGQNADPEAAPDVINNSWYCSPEEGCTDLSVNELIHQALINLRNSGVVVVVSNGNSGGAGCASTTGAPAYFEESFSVGATRSNDGIALFSSRGPVSVDGSNRIKPNVAAPGQDIRSSVPNNGYANYSGTSMAGPHVVGLVALVLSARPDLAGQVELIETLIEQTAIPYADTFGCTNPGDLRPNNIFGWGTVDALAAVNAALALPVVTTGAPVDQPLAAQVFPNPVPAETVFDLQNLSGNTTLKIISVQGQVVFQKTWNAPTRELVPVSLKNQAAGVYFWQVRSGNGWLTGKIVKE